MLFLLLLLRQFLVGVTLFLLVPTLYGFTSQAASNRMRLYSIQRTIVSSVPRFQLSANKHFAARTLFGSKSAYFASFPSKQRDYRHDPGKSTARHASTLQNQNKKEDTESIEDSKEDPQIIDRTDDYSGLFVDADEEDTDEMEDMDDEPVSNEMDFSNYEKWVRRLYSTNMFHPVKMGLKNMEELHLLLERPMDKRTVVHIAGTNGKGSVALKIAKTLELSNPDLTIGLFSSPHVSSFRERMQVNGEMISEKEVAALLPPIYSVCKEYDIPATFFELTTALAFAYFSMSDADVVVLETGLGGRLDATNVIKAPALSVITSIGLEHTRILGDTIEKIALEKGGIIKPGSPVLVGPHAPHDVLRQCASEKDASHYYTCDDVLGEPEETNTDDFEDYDLENARIATAAVKLLQKSHPNIVGDSISEDILKEGTSFRPPCRFEHILLSGFSIVLDVAHNPPAMAYLVRKLQKTYPDAKFRFVVGMSSDKDLSLCGASLMKAVEDDPSRIHLVEAAHPRAAKLEAIFKANSGFETHAHYDLDDRSVMNQVHEAMKNALTSEEAEKEMMVVCGSVFIMAEAREALGFDEPRDSPYIAEMAGAGVRHGQENFGNSSISVDGDPDDDEFDAEDQEIDEENNAVEGDDGSDDGDDDDKEED